MTMSKNSLKYLVFVSLMFFSLGAGCKSGVYDNADLTLGQMLCNIKHQAFLGTYKLINVFAYISGTGMLITAVFKLKQVKDNPTQIPVSTPMALFLVATLLLFLPSIFNPAGETIFGSGSNIATGEEMLGEGGGSTVTIPNLVGDDQ